jgi:hypothetical protein
MCGFSVAITVLWEIPIFHYSGKVCSTFNMHQLIVIACLSYIVRYEAINPIP